jgi:hypothetical protein
MSLGGIVAVTFWTEQRVGELKVRWNQNGQLRRKFAQRWALHRVTP